MDMMRKEKRVSKALEAICEEMPSVIYSIKCLEWKSEEEKDAMFMDMIKEVAWSKTITDAYEKILDMKKQYKLEKVMKKEEDKVKVIEVDVAEVPMEEMFEEPDMD